MLRMERQTAIITNLQRKGAVRTGPLDFPFLPWTPAPPHTLGLLSVLETQARVFNILAVSISFLLL